MATIKTTASLQPGPDSLGQVTKILSFNLALTHCSLVYLVYTFVIIIQLGLIIVVAVVKTKIIIIFKRYCSNLPTALFESEEY